MTEPLFQQAIAAALGPHAESPANPNGGAGFYVDTEATGYHVYYRQDSDPAEFDTADKAIVAAVEYRAMADADPSLV